MRRLRQWLGTPIVARLVILAGVALIGLGYSLVWLPVGATPGDVEQITRQAVSGILLVALGAALVAGVAFWRD